MNKRCKHIGKDGFRCGSHAFNLYKDDIEQGDLCDVHYWQAKAQRTWVGLTEEEISKISQRLGIDHDDSWTDLKQVIEAKLKERNDHSI